LVEPGEVCARLQTFDLFQALDCTVSYLTTRQAAAGITLRLLRHGVDLLHEVEGVIVDPRFLCGCRHPDFCRELVAALDEE
jgi:hypothetical protein